MRIWWLHVCEDCGWDCIRSERFDGARCPLCAEDGHSVELRITEVDGSHPDVEGRDDRDAKLIDVFVAACDGVLVIKG